MNYLYKKGDRVVYMGVIITTIVDYAGFIDGIPHYSVADGGVIGDIVSQSNLTLYHGVEDMEQLELFPNASILGSAKCECGVASLGYDFHSYWCPLSKKESV